MMSLSSTHKILLVLAKMKRNVMREFKRRLLWAMDKAESGARCTPSRMYLQYLDCAFLFLPLEGRDKVEPLSLLEGYAKLCKQDLRSRLCLASGCQGTASIRRAKLVYDQLVTP